MDMGKKIKLLLVISLVCLIAAGLMRVWVWSIEAKENAASAKWQRERPERERLEKERQLAELLTIDYFFSVFLSRTKKFGAGLCA